MGNIAFIFFHLARNDFYIVILITTGRFMKTISLLPLLLLSCTLPVLKAQVNDCPASAQYYFGVSR
jgi:hypothetical protein